MNSHLFSRLRDLKMVRKLKKSLGERMELARETQPTYIEYPLNLSRESVLATVAPVLEKLWISEGGVDLRPAKNITAGVRVFHRGKILDLSLDLIEANLFKTF